MQDEIDGRVEESVDYREENENNKTSDEDSDGEINGSESDLSEDENEVSFSNNNVNIKGHKEDENKEEINSEEMKSMGKFAKFLEKHGYIRQENVSKGDQPGNSGMRVSTGDRAATNKRNSKEEGMCNNKANIDQESEATLYNNAVVIDFSDESNSP